jgi:hypothetical protein
MKTKLSFLALIEICLLCVTARADVASDFGDGAGYDTFQGWTKSTELSEFGGNLYVSYAGSHPYAMHAYDTCAGCGSLIVAAPPQFRGDLSACTGITWEEYIPDANRADTELNTCVILIGLNGTRFDSLQPVRGPLHTWISRSAPLQESAWQRVGGTNSFAEVLQNVQHLLAVIEIGINDASRDEAYLDNIRVVGKTACSSSAIPGILNQPVDRNVCLGGATTFSVAATGAPTLRYQWQFNRTNNLVGQTNAQLTLSNVQWADFGKYRAVVFNNCGSITSEEGSLTLTSSGHPMIVEQPVNHSRCFSGHVTFRVRAVGGEPLLYQWQFNGTNLPGMTGSELTLTNVQTNHQGSYCVLVTQSAPCSGSVTSVVATLTIGGPVMVEQPVSQQGPEGGSVTFSALADGTEPFQYQWQFNGTNLPGKIDAELMLTNIQAQDFGEYCVIVTNSCGSVTSAVAYLWYVCPPPSIVMNPGNRGVMAGSEAAFWVIARGRETTHYQWQFYGTNLLDETNSVLTLTSVQTNDAGQYRVFVTDTCGSVTGAVACLAVAVDGQWTCYTNNIRAGFNLIGHQLDYGGNTLDEIMPSVPEGTELFKFSLASNLWESALYLNGEWHDIASLGWPERIAWSPGEGAWLVTTQAFTLTFCGAVRQPVLPLNVSDNKYVWCSRQTPLTATYEDIVGQVAPVKTKLFQWDATNYLYRVYTRAAGGWLPATPVASVGEAVVVSVSGGPTPCMPPRILSHPAAQAVDCGGEATFSVTADIAGGCSPSPGSTYQWYVNESPIPGAVSTNLTITNASRADSGFYWVAISNQWGLARSLLAAFEIVDATGPAISACATNQTLAADANCVTILPDLTSQVVASDNCGTVWITQDPLPGTALNVGTNRVTFTAVDEAGNSNTCTIQAIVVDITPPVITCPADVQTVCSSTNGAQVFFAATATDNCDPSPLITSLPPSGSWFPNGTMIVTCKATDSSGNTNICSFTVTVVDSVTPLLHLAAEGTNVAICWPQTCTRFVLEESGSLNPPGWTTSTAVVDGSGTQYCVRVTAGPANKYFRLRGVSP